MFAWFDTPESDSGTPLEIWAEPLEAYHETTDPNEARQLLNAAEREAHHSKSDADGPLWAFALDYECAPWFDRAYANALPIARRGGCACGALVATAFCRAT
jgi:hypothetical protein